MVLVLVLVGQAVLGSGVLQAHWALLELQALVELVVEPGQEQE